MTSREIIRSIARHRPAPRIGFNFPAPWPNDIRSVRGARLVSRAKLPVTPWGQHAELLARVPGFSGEVAVDIYGNILGRFHGKTKGECVRGWLQEGWEDFDEALLPALDMSYYGEIDADALRRTDQYVMAHLPVSLFSSLRDSRLMANALMDSLLEPEQVARFVGRLADLNCQAIAALAPLGVDGVMTGDDWGTQDRTFISPDTFREVFYPFYQQVFQAARARGMDTFMHSCGNVHGIMDHLIEAGLDVFQFDQPELRGSANLAREFGGRAAFWSPVDIQKVMPTGDRAYIEQTALEMTEAFKAAGGCLIAMDYGSWGDIGVEQEWADWARNVIINNAEIK